MAQGMRHGRSGVPPSGMGKAEENDGAACTAGKAWQPMLWLSVKPKMPLTWLYVTSLAVGVAANRKGRAGLVEWSMCDVKFLKETIRDNGSISTAATTTNADGHRSTPQKRLSF